MTIRTPNVPWQVSWAGGQWLLLPGDPVTVLERQPLWQAAKIQFENPSPLEMPRVLYAIVPTDDLDFHTTLVPA
jgi:hypothetical protein